MTERHQRGSSRVHCGGSRRAAASGAPGGLWKADARYIGVHGTVTPGGRHVVTMVLCRVGCVRRGGPVCAGQARCPDTVRGCPCGRAARSPRARTYSGQRRHSGHHPVASAQVRWYLEVQAGKYCKTVGSAYVGSNPTPATTCENGPWAAETRPGGPFSSCHAVYQGASLWVDAWQCARTYGVQRPGKTSGAHNRFALPIHAGFVPQSGTGMLV